MQMTRLTLLATSLLVLAVGGAAWAQTTTPAGEDAPADVEPDSGAPAPAEAPATQPAGGQGGQPAPGPPGGRNWGNFLPLILLGGVFLLWFWMGRGRRKEQQRRKEMLSALKKGDKVTTIGGIVGTVIDVKGDEVAVKVDESANVRMRFARWAVRGVGEEAKAEKPGEAEKQ